ncbi:hypothetical protein [Spirulina sp. 06S082]|uniref:hypothetical protein n=1 Tax=Spirulina sp. 06S082 TaxID=3110248 RepID=UPI002B209087|nr:hypothetical protein [Spirulina sp. 06S082]MEA5470375.1 hypothetical protein [Spirulina sp. 06S082]
MKYLITGCILISIFGCQSSQKIDEESSQVEECPTEPQVVLQKDAVESINLTETMTTQSGIAKKNKSLGYRFEAEAKQRFDYQTEQEICVWLYTPDMTLLNSGELPQDGAYIVQITAPSGSATFDLAMGLDVKKSASQPSPTPQPSSPQSVSSSPSIAIVPASPNNPPTIQRTSPTEFIKNHYISLSQRQYQATWNRLTPNFQKVAKGYTEYVNWWQKVREIQIGEIRLIDMDEGSAIVDANLRYVMHTGKSFPDSNRRIYLIWNDSTGDWLINQKKQP